jgi:hypothetical protein
MLSTAMLAMGLLLAQDHHHHDVDRRGDQVMGFAHDKTMHHFRLFADGGAIEVTANDTSDTASRDKIRMHLGHIAKKFAAGDFAAPMLIHNTKVPGTTVMAAKRAAIEYRYEDLPQGGRVKIKTADKQALAAVHEFLRFQISDHRTGDSGKVE